MKPLKRTFCLQNVVIPALLLITAVNLLYTGDEGNRGVLYGNVIDSETKSPVAFVNIVITGTELYTATDEGGNFRFDNVPDGAYSLQFSHINYNIYTYDHVFTRGIKTSVTIEMRGRPILIEEVEITDTPLDRFDGRVPAGYYYTKKEIDNTAAVTFGQLIQALVPRAQVREVGGNLYIQFQLRETIYQRHEVSRYPYPLIIINGMHLGTSPIGLSSVAPPSQINEMQVIRPPESQVYFGPEATHGVIIIETIPGSADDSFLSSRQLNFIVGGIVAFMLSVFIFF